MVWGLQCNQPQLEQFIPFDYMLVDNQLWLLKLTIFAPLTQMHALVAIIYLPKKMEPTYSAL